MKKFFKRAFLILCAFFLLIQVVPAKRTNPPVDPAKTLKAPPEILAILRTSCYDCHSNETRWPWYSYVAPVSWWTVDHVETGRKLMNFSDWADYTTGQQQDYLDGTSQLVQKGDMPLPSYLIIHRDAILTPDQRNQIAAWTAAEIKRLDETPAPTPAAPAPAATPKAATP